MITVFGLGFVGLTSSLGFAEKGLKVYGIEKDINKYQKLLNGEISFYEPHLEEKLKENLETGNFVVSKDINEAISNSNVIMICVGTPCLKEGQVDLKQIKNVIDEIHLSTIDSFKVICIKSTVPPSTITREIKPYIQNKFGSQFNKLGISHNPEFLREGHAYEDFINPDRIIIGSADQKSKILMNEIYNNFNSPIFNVNINTAEYIKYASNSLLTSLISFANELEMIAYSVGDVDIKNAFKILHLYSRWIGNPCLMSSYAYPGFGFGGYCLPKDIQALIYKSEENNYKPELLKEIYKVNSKIKKFILNRILKELNPGEKICILGLSFKPGSDDVRESPSGFIIEQLINNNFNNIIAFDPMASNNFKKIYNFNIEYAITLKDALENSSSIILATSWPEFKEVKNLIRSSQKLFDLRFYL